MARTEQLQNKHGIATRALAKLNRQLARGGSCLQQKKIANKVRCQLEKIKNLSHQLGHSGPSGKTAAHR